jgi:AcrR family transcriptional regulator
MGVPVGTAASESCWRSGRRLVVVHPTTYLLLVTRPTELPYPGRVPRLTFDERRASILAAALRVVAGKGFAATTTRDVAAEAGVRVGLLHHYFPSHDDLLAAAFEQGAHEERTALERRVAAAVDPVEKLRRLVHDFGPVREDPAVLLWIDAWSEAPRNPRLRATTDRQNAAWTDMITGIIAEGVAAGMFTSDDPDSSAWVVLALLDGMAIQLAVGEAIGPRRAQRLVRAAIEDHLGLERGALDRRRRRRAPGSDQ